MTTPILPTDCDPLARALLPIILHKLANATQLLSGMNAMLGLEGGDELFNARASDLSRCSLDLNRLGWALAVVASGSGADLLLSRREPRGLETLLGLVGDACRREGCAGISLPEPLPRLTPGALSGWELPWALASLLLAAAEEQGSGTLQWSLEPVGEAGWELRLGESEGLAERARQVLPHLQGAQWHCADGRACLQMPAAWLAKE